MRIRIRNTGKKMQILRIRIPLSKQKILKQKMYKQNEILRKKIMSKRKKFAAVRTQEIICRRHDNEKSNADAKNVTEATGSQTYNGSQEYLR